jgi:ABC-type Mn2+/Zn2+ transport system permease subunit
MIAKTPLAKMTLNMKKVFSATLTDTAITKSTAFALIATVSIGEIFLQGMKKNRKTTIMCEGDAKRMGANEVIIFAIEALVSLLLVIGFFYEEKVARFERKLAKAVKRLCRKLF